jgi:hypothetical protein
MTLNESFLYSIEHRGLEMRAHMVFNAAFAVNSSLHTYLIVSLTTRDRISINSGCYYMPMPWAVLSAQ